MATGWTGRGVLPVACVLGVVACGLDFDRYDPQASDGGLVEGGDASTIDHVAESSTGNDVAQENVVNPCNPVAGILVAPLASGAITVDGDLGDWGTTAFTLLDASDAALIMGPNGDCTAANATSMCLVPNGETAEFAFLRDASNLYVGARVTVPNVGGGSTMNPFTNDAIEIYLRGDAFPTGDYTTLDHQYVVDWQNLVVDYGPSQTDTGVANPTGVTSAVKVAANLDSYVVEVKVALSELGQPSLAPGQTLGLDFGVDHGQGTEATRSFLSWWMAMHAPPPCATPKCKGCSPDQPYCDTLDFGVLCAE